MTLARPADYWFSNYAIFIQLNATGDRNYIHANCSSGSMVMCYMRDIPGLGYDNAHNYRRWPLIASPTVFHDNLARYVYIAIPKSEDADAVAEVVFPSEKIDIYGCNENGTQIGQDTHFYIFTQGIISPSEVGGVVQNRTWQQIIDSGQLDSDESIAAGGSDSWWEYIASSDMVKFLKVIAEATFDKLNAAWISVKQLVLNGKTLNSVASDSTPDNAADAIATPRYISKNFLSKMKPDETDFLIKFLSGLECGEFSQGSTGVGVYKDDAGNWHLETDYLDVRMKFTARDVEIQKVFHIGGAQIKSSASMKCVRVEEMADAYRCYMNTIDDDGKVIYNQFKVGDQAYVQTFNLERQADGTLGNHFFWRLVTEIGTDYIDLSKSICAFASDAPKKFDDIVQLGYRGIDDNTRQVAVIDAGAGEGAPFYRQYVGINSFHLPEPETQLKPGDNRLSGTFILTTGEDVKTKFEIVEGKIQSSIESVSKGFLSNPSFETNFEHWISRGNETVFFIFDKYWIWANNHMLSRNGDGTSLVEDGGRNVVLIKNSSINQLSTEYVALPKITTNEDGLKKPAPVCLSFYYKVRKSGMLNVGFTNEDNSGFIEYKSFSHSETLSVSDKYNQMTINGLWSGTGDFHFSFSGEMYVYMLILGEDMAGSLEYTYRTLFEQSDRLVQISAAIFGENKKLLQESGIVVKPEGSGLYVQDVNGSVGLIGVSVEETDSDGHTKSVIKLTADNIQLEGIVTANGNFKILDDGSIEAKNGDFNGVFVSVDEIMGNSIILDSKQGFIKMRGPSSVEDLSGLPSTDERIDLLDVHFEVDSDTLSRVCSINIYGMDRMIRIDPVEGVFMKGQHGTIRIDHESGISVYAEDFDGEHKVHSFFGADGLRIYGSNGELVKSFTL